MNEKNREVMKNILYAVETGGQVYGKQRYDDFTAAYTNSSAEHAITIGAGAWYGTEAKRLLSLIRDTDPSGWKARDTAGIGTDLDTAVWSTYKLEKGSAKAICIVNIINSAVGIACQDLLMMNQIKEKEESITKKYGSMPDGAMMECINIQHQGGANALARILQKTVRPLTADSIYAALCTDPDDKSNNNQVGDYTTRQKKVYEMIQKYAIVEEEKTMTQMEQRKAIVNWLKQYVGISEGSAQHKAILKVFNDSGLCTRYKMTIYDAWCATAASAAYIANGLGNIFPNECSCYYMIENAKKMGIWVENDAYVPSIADAVLYDWDDSGAGDNQGNPEHVGLVYSISGSTMQIIEGNKNNTVGIRTLQVNGRYIRGYVTPKFTGTAAAPKTETPVATTSGTTLNRNVKWTGIVTADELNVRTWAGVNNATCSFSPLKQNTEVGICDSVKASDGSVWYYIKYNGKYGFVHSGWIKKKASATTNTNTKVTATDYAEKLDKALAGTYKTTDDLNMRTGAGTGKAVMVVLPKGTTVKNYGYYSMNNGSKWLYIQATVKGVTYTGFSCSDYLQKV